MIQGVSRRLPGRKLPAVFIAAGLFLTMVCAEGPAERAVPPGAPAVSAKVVYAGVRSSKYGAKPFPAPAGWGKAIGAMASGFPGSTPCAVWIVGTMARTPRFAHLEFPSDGRTHPGIEFEPETAMNRIFPISTRPGSRYSSRSSPPTPTWRPSSTSSSADTSTTPASSASASTSNGTSVADKPGTGTAVDDATARGWEARVKSHNP